MKIFLAMLRGMVACLIFLPLCSSAAESGPTTSTLINQARLKALSTHPYWLKLIHYKPSGSKQAPEFTSEIISPGFFLSPEGRTNPEAELIATLNALFLPEGASPDSHAQCRFIARYRWLRKELNWSDSVPPSIACKSYNDWTLQGQIESVSLVFVTGYLSNPASFYGHILLKANPSRGVIPVDLLDQSVNYGAIVPENENPAMYVLKGVFGGYQATFSNAQFYRHNHNYGENELRDMWEYELTLDQEQIDQLLTHAWELLGTEFTYYFARENCAYRMSELLGLVIDEPLVRYDSPWIMPTMVFDRLATAQMDNHPAVRQTKLIQSRQSRFYSGFSTLSNTQREITKSLARKEIDLNDARIGELSEEEQIQLLDVLLDYHEFRILSEENDAEFRRAKTALLIQRSRLKGASANTTPSTPLNSAPPHHAPLPSMIRAGWINNHVRGNGVELHFRPAYYDLLTPNTGRIPNSKLTMFELKAARIQDQFELRSLDLVNIETLNLSQTNLPGDGGPAWKLKFGLDSQDLNCSHCMIFNVNGGIGKALRLTDETLIYGMIEGLAQTSHQDSGTLAGIARAALLTAPCNFWKTGLSVGHKRYLNQSNETHRQISWENRLGNSRHWDIRINYGENVGRELLLAGSYYW